MSTASVLGIAENLQNKRLESQGLLESLKFALKRVVNVANCEPLRTNQPEAVSPLLKTLVAQIQSSLCSAAAVMHFTFGNVSALPFSAPDGIPQRISR